MPQPPITLISLSDGPQIGRAPDPCAEGTLRRPGLGPLGFERLERWMRARMDEPLTEEMMCAQCQLPVAALRRAFLNRVGMLPMEFLTWLRVDVAVRLLVDTRFGIDEIAYVAGFKTAERLAEACLQTLGVRPQALRVTLA